MQDNINESIQRLFIQHKELDKKLDKTINRNIDLSGENEALKIKLKNAIDNYIIVMDGNESLKTELEATREMLALERGIKKCQCPTEQVELPPVNTLAYNHNQDCFYLISDYGGRTVEQRVEGNHLNKDATKIKKKYEHLYG